MIPLLKIWSFSHYKLLKLNALLTLTGIAFGVALFTSVQIANQNIRDSFKWTIEQVAGHGELEVKGGVAGFSEEEIVKVRHLPGVKGAMPVTLQSVWVGEKKEKEEVMVLGRDMVSDALGHPEKPGQENSPETPGLNVLLKPAAIMITPFLAKRFHLNTGSTFVLHLGSEVVETRVVGIIQFENELPPPYGGYFVMMDIAASQLLFHKLGRLDRIHIQLDEGVSGEAMKEALTTALPGLQIQSPGDEKQMIDSLLGSFNLNIKALSEISILVGMFLIYNTMSFLVVRRKVEIGIIRMLGVSGREVFRLILMEAFVIGFIGSVLGIGLGIWIAHFVLKAVALTITSLYLKVFTQSISVSFTTGLLSLSIGLCVSLLAAAFPAWEASRVKLRDNLNRAGEIRPPRLSLSLLAAGGILLIFSWFFSKLPPYHQVPVFGYLSALFLLAGTSLMIPSTLYVLYRILRSPFLNEKMVFLKVAGSGFFQQSTRNGIGIATLMISVSLVISVTLMISSFRKTLEIWFNQTVKADLIVEPKEWLNPGDLPLILPDLAEKIKRVNGVAAVDLFREEHLMYQNRPFRLDSRLLQVHLEQSQYLFTSGNASQKMEEAIQGKVILISESFSLQHHLNEGDILKLNSPAGSIPFRIGGIFYDYTTQGGKVVMDRSAYLKYWKDERLNILAVYLVKKGDLHKRESEVKEKLESILNGEEMIVISNQEIRSKVLEIFDQTFSVTRVLEWITILISLLGVINMLMANLLDQKREIGILRSIGASRNQIGVLVLMEALWIILVANLLGGVGGTALSLILIHVINKQSFFWTIQFDLSPMIYFRTFMIVTATALLAAFIPAKNKAGENIREAVQYE
ncbi:MAG: ABC transporter permease [Nitrospirae bacterium]|nr:ABC transporter permease [Nitrospirota bacterium]MBI3593657.1 ABC transporter permease [Nitrospirota bacterium]